MLDQQSQLRKTLEQN